MYIDAWDNVSLRYPLFTCMQTVDIHLCMVVVVVGVVAGVLSLTLAHSLWRQAVAAGDYHTCGIAKGTNQMHCWGAGAPGDTTSGMNYGQATVPAGVQEWVVSARTANPLPP